MRHHVIPYLAFLASFGVFVYLLQEADTAGYLASFALAAMVWWWVGNLVRRPRA